MTKHMRNLDIAKGMCMLFMITCHVFGWTGYLSIVNKYTAIFFLVFFFFSAGICFKGNEKFIPYILKRIKKLLIPYTAITIIYFAYYGYVGKNFAGYEVLAIMKRCLVSLIVASPSWISDVSFFHVDNISVGPAWFWSCLFFSYFLYFFIYKFKYRLFLSVILSAISAWSMQKFILPFNIQVALVGCMFMAIGDCLREYIIIFFDWIKRCKLYQNTLITVGIGVVFFITINKLPYQWMNLGANQYFMISIISTLLGFALMMSFIEIMEKIKIGDKLLEYIGLNSMFILAIHHIDIMMFRNWGTFQLEPSQLTASCLLGYLFIVMIKDKFFVSEK